VDAAADLVGVPRLGDLRPPQSPALFQAAVLGIFR